MRESVVIRQARPEDAPICRMLLPDTAHRGLHALYIAAMPQRPYVAGAACALRAPDRLESVYVHVIPPLRRRGIGSLLLHYILAIATAANATSVSGWSDVCQETAAPPFAAAHGFTPGARLTTVECDPDVVYAYFDRIRSRWQRPGQAQHCHIVPLREADRDAVARLWNTYIAERPGFRTDVIAAELQSGVFDDSPVLLHDGAVAGFLLLRFEADWGWVVAQVIAPWARHGWAAAALNVAGCDVARAHQARRVRFDWREGVQYTSKLAQRLDARVVRVLQKFTRSVAG
jgi:GNAT superfamily N-acetyltransferase